MNTGQKVKNAKDFRVVRAGKGQGLGLIAKLGYKKGDFIIEYIGKKLTNKEAEDNTTKYLFDLDKKFTIDGSPRWNIARYINHSCRPNAEADIVKGHILISAIKTINPGDEINYDYGKEYFNEFIKPYGCKCIKCKKKK